MTAQLLTTVCILMPCAMAWHAVMKWIDLARGDRLSKDRFGEHQRAILTLEAKSKTRDVQYVEMLQRIDGFVVIRAEVQERCTAHEQNLAKFMNETMSEIDKLKQNQTMALQGLSAMGNQRQMPNIPGNGGFR